MEIVGKARQPAMKPPPVISSAGGSIKDIKHHPQFSKNLAREEPEASQSTCYRNKNSAFSPQRLEGTMEIVVESRNSVTNLASDFSSTGGLGLSKEEQNNDQEEKVEHKVEEEDEYDKQVNDDKYDKQVMEVYEDKQVKEVDVDKQVKKVHEDKQVKEAYKFNSYRYKMFKILYRTSLFLTYKVLQIPWNQ